MLMFAIAQVVICSALFIAFGLFRSKRTSPQSKQKDGSLEFEILQRGRERKGVKTSESFNWAMGLVYSGGFYLLLPVLIWRYGLWMALILIVVPLAIGGGIGLGLGRMEIGLLTGFFLRGYGGLIAARNDQRLHRKALLRRGWQIGGFEIAASSKAALLQFNRRTQ